MASGPGLLRQVYNAAEARIAPPLTSLLHSDGFAQANRWNNRTQVAMRRRADAAVARVWHLWNLPAGTDVRRLRAQVGELDLQVRRLRMQLEQRHLADEISKEDRDGTRSHVDH